VDGDEEVRGTVDSVGEGEGKGRVGALLGDDLVHVGPGHEVAAALALGNIRKDTDKEDNAQVAADQNVDRVGLAAGEALRDAPFVVVVASCDLDPLPNDQETRTRCSSFRLPSIHHPRYQRERCH